MRSHRIKSFLEATKLARGRGKFKRRPGGNAAGYFSMEGGD